MCPGASTPSLGGTATPQALPNRPFFIVNLQTKTAAEKRSSAAVFVVQGAEHPALSMADEKKFGGQILQEIINAAESCVPHKKEPAQPDGFFPSAIDY